MYTFYSQCIQTVFHALAGPLLKYSSVLSCSLQAISSHFNSPFQHILSTTVLKHTTFGSRVNSLIIFQVDFSSGDEKKEREGKDALKLIAMESYYQGWCFPVGISVNFVIFKVPLSKQIKKLLTHEKLFPMCKS